MLTEGERKEYLNRFQSMLEWTRTGHAMPTVSYYDLLWCVDKLEYLDDEVKALKLEIAQLRGNA